MPTHLDPQQAKIWNVFQYVPADDSSYWTPALRDADVTTLEFALAHKDDPPALGKTKLKKIEARLRALQNHQPAPQIAPTVSAVEILTDMTRAELRACESVIAHGKRAFEDVGNSLRDIRDRRGYRFEFSTFDEYCATRWGWSRQNAAYYIGAAEVVKALPEMSSRLDISHAAELARLTKSKSANGNGTEDTAPRADKRKKEIDHTAVREVVETLDLSKATVKQVAAVVDEKIKQQKRAAKRNELAAQAADFENTLSVQVNATRTSDIKIYCDDVRNLKRYVQADSAHLVITSPPYNIGMPYDGYRDKLKPIEYTRLLTAAFTQYHRALCDGGRIAVVVPIGVDRNPWRLLAADIHQYLVLTGFTPRGWIVWDKMTAQNRTSWGSHRQFTSPHLRDMSEVVIVMHKGKDRLPAPQGVLLQDERGKYSPFLRDADYFAELSQNNWKVRPETSLVGQHPAPFPVALAERLIHFYAYPGALVVDGMAGSGTVGVAAKQNGCRAVLVEQSKIYCALARKRLKEI